MLLLENINETRVRPFLVFHKLLPCEKVMRVSHTMTKQRHFGDTLIQLRENEHGVYIPFFSWFGCMVEKDGYIVERGTSCRKDRIKFIPYYHH